jgi:hypothetical protein
MKIFHLNKTLKLRYTFETFKLKIIFSALIVFLQELLCHTLYAHKEQSRPVLPFNCEIVYDAINYSESNRIRKTALFHW